jgi:hypothetical protein
MVTEFPSEAPLLDPRDDLNIRRVPDDPESEHALLGERVFFVTQVGAWPGIVVAYDATTKRADIQVFNRKTDGCNLVRAVRHIRSDDAPCWAWKHETPFQGLQSLNRGAETPKRAHTRKQTGGVRV